jgi:hypothetical protein
LRKARGAGRVERYMRELREPPKRETRNRARENGKKMMQREDRRAEGSSIYGIWKAAG